MKSIGINNLIVSLIFFLTAGCEDSGLSDSDIGDQHESINVDATPFSECENVVLIWEESTNYNEKIKIDTFEQLGNVLLLTDSIKIDKAVINSLLYQEDKILNYDDMIFRLENSAVHYYLGETIEVFEIWWYKDSDLHRDFSSLFFYTQNYEVKW